jgi:hypothetical protein
MGNDEARRRSSSGRRLMADAPEKLRFIVRTGDGRGLV